jgi:hypothetical protein
MYLGTAHGASVGLAFLARSLSARRTPGGSAARSASGDTTARAHPITRGLCCPAATVGVPVAPRVPSCSPTRRRAIPDGCRTLPIVASLAHASAAACGQPARAETSLRGALLAPRIAPPMDQRLRYGAWFSRPLLGRARSMGCDCRPVPTPSDPAALPPTPCRIGAPLKNFDQWPLAARLRGYSALCVSSHRGASRTPLPVAGFAAA